MSFAKEMSDFLGAYKTVTKTLDDSAYTRASTGFTQARTRALTADQDAVDAAVARTERRINTTSPQAAVGATPTGGAPSNIDPRVIDQYLGRMVSHESSGDPNARASTSSATGLAQFTDDTWAGMMRDHPELRLTANGRTDPEQAMRAARQFTYNNAAVLDRAGLPATPGNLYMTHFLGASGGPTFLRQMQQNPDAPATQFVDQRAAAANRRVFFNRDGSPRTARQVYDLQTRSFRDIRVGDDQMPAAPAQSAAVERAPLAAPTRSQTVAQASPAPGASPYDERGMLRPEHGGLTGTAQEQAARTGVAPQQFAEGGLVQESPDGDPPTERAAALPTTPPPPAATPAPDGPPADASVAPTQAPVPMARPNESEIEQRQVADALRQREKPATPAEQAPPPADASRARALPTEDPAPAPTRAPAQAAAPQRQNTGIAGILDGALRYIATRLPPPRGIPSGAVAYALGRNDDTPTPSQYQTVSDAVDPSGELSAGQRAIRVMQARHDLALQKGDIAGANRFAAGIIQYSQRLTARIASIGIVAGQNGNVGGMVAATAAAFNAIPAGAQITPGQPTRDGQIPVTIREPNGRTRSITLSPRQVMETALGLQNGGLYWETLQRAAAQHSSSQSGGMDPAAFERHMQGDPAVTPRSNDTPAPAQTAPAPAAPAAPAPSAAAPSGGATPAAPAAPEAPPVPLGPETAPTPATPAPAAPTPSAPAPSAPAPAAPEAPPVPAPAPSGGTAVARTSALPTEMSAPREAGRPSREPSTPRPVRPRTIPVTQDMNAAQRAAVNQRNQAAVAEYNDQLKTYNAEREAILREDAAQRTAGYSQDRQDQRLDRADQRMDQREQSRQAAERRLEEAKHRYAQQQAVLTARRTEGQAQANAARLHRPTAENIRSILPDIDATMTAGMDPRSSGGNGNETFQRVYGYDTKSRSVASGVYNSMVDTAARLAIWGHTPQQAADAARIMVTAPDAAPGQPPFRVLPEKDAAGNIQVVLLRPGAQGQEPQEFGGVIAMDPNTLRQITNARRDAMPLVTRREEQTKKGDGELWGIMRDLGMAVDGAMRTPAERPSLVTPDMRQNRRQAIRAEADRVQAAGERERARREGRGRVLDDADRAAMMGRSNGVE